MPGRDETGQQSRGKWTYAVVGAAIAAVLAYAVSVYQGQVAPPPLANAASEAAIEPDEKDGEPLEPEPPPVE